MSEKTPNNDNAAPDSSESLFDPEKSFKNEMSIALCDLPYIEAEGDFRKIIDELWELATKQGQELREPRS
jgi:hypothetical protein